MLHFRIFNTLKRLTFFHPLINSLLKHPLINLVIKSNATCYSKQNVKTSVTTYIHATTYIHVKPIFTQELMIWLQKFEQLSTPIQVIQG